MQYHLGVLRMLLFATLLVEMNGTKVQASRSSLFHSSTKSLKGKAVMIKALESRLLNIFGLKERPRPTNVRRNIPEFMMELYRAQNLVQIEESFPKPSSLRKRALELHQHHQGRSIYASTTNTVRSFVAEPEYPDEEYDNTKDLHLWFNVTSLLSEELLRAAELRVFRLRRRAGCGVVRDGVGASSSPPDSSRGEHAAADNRARQNPRQKNKLKKRTPRRENGVYLQVYDVLRPGAKLSHIRPIGDSQSERAQFARTDPLLRLIDTRFVSTDHDAWESFDVAPAIRRWRNRPSENHGLILRLAHPNGKTIRLRNGSGAATRSVDRCYGGIGDLSSPVDRQPLLVTYTDDGRDAALRSSRTKRNARLDRRRKRKHCQRKNLYVDFQDVGWNNWIVAPPGYHAYHCQGDCPFPLSDHFNSTNHAIVQTLVNSANPTLVPRACCVPTELSPISLLYVDEYEKIVLKNYQDMVVEGCGCR